MTDLTQQARSLLAQQYKHDGDKAKAIRIGHKSLPLASQAAVRAIEAALRTSAAGCQHDWQTGYGVAPYCSHCGATGGEGTSTPDAGGRDTATVPQAFLELAEEVLERDGGKACGCIFHSRTAEREYDAGKCPHQRIAEMLAAIAQREGS